MSEINIREAVIDDAAAIARVRVDTWRATYAGIVPDQVLADLSYEVSTQRWRDSLASIQPDRFVYVADEAGQVVGFATGGLERTEDAVYKGEIFALYILPAAQGRGLGRRLAQASARYLAHNGIGTLLIWALAANPACGFYAALGGQPVREKNVEIGGKLLLEVGYGWLDTTQLIGGKP